jgi:hypothetical protein
MEIRPRNEGSYGLEYVRGWRENVKWFRSDAERVRWILANDERVWIGRRLYRALPTVTGRYSGPSRLAGILRQKAAAIGLLTRRNS